MNQTLFQKEAQTTLNVWWRRVRMPCRSRPNFDDNLENILNRMIKNAKIYVNNFHSMCGSNFGNFSYQFKDN